MFLKLLLVGLGIAAADIFGPGGWLGLEDCWDRESLKYCNDAKANGYCTRPDKWRDMRIKCEQTCKLCGQPTPVPITVSTIWCSDD
ncbi:unnamed protein product [Heligmosomoides polygyrus]|uniref:ShKT domain-containing protein n=1 Tax=Heligmosomoides polygyrus TaxID=6339 RepID=A0A183FMN5_HELPZ|nr:unnamed protein product [Heligmosomoides polygyrus]